MAFPNPADASQIARRPDPRLLRSRRASTSATSPLNTTKKPFDDVRVRRAINMAIDKAAIVEAVYQGAGVVGEEPDPADAWSYNDDVEDYPFDLAAAQRLLAEAGYPERLRDRALVHAGEPALQPERQARRRDDPGGSRQASASACKLVTDEWSQYRHELQAGEAPMALFGWTGDNGDPDNFLARAARLHGGPRRRQQRRQVVRRRTTTPSSRRRRCWPTAPSASGSTGRRRRSSRRRRPGCRSRIRSSSWRRAGRSPGFRDGPARPPPLRGRRPQALARARPRRRWRELARARRGPAADRTRRTIQPSPSTQSLRRATRAGFVARRDANGRSGRAAAASAGQRRLAAARRAGGRTAGAGRGDRPQEREQHRHRARRRAAKASARGQNMEQ